MSTDDRRQTILAEGLSIPSQDKLEIPKETENGLVMPGVAPSATEQLRVLSVPAARHAESPSHTQEREEPGLFSRFTSWVGSFFSSSKDTSPNAASGEAELLARMLREERQDDNTDFFSFRSKEHLRSEAEPNEERTGLYSSAETNSNDSLAIFKMMNWARSKFAMFNQETVREVEDTRGAVVAAALQSAVDDSKNARLRS